MTVLDTLLYVGTAFMIFMPLERFFARRKGQKSLRSRWQLDLIYASLGGLIINAGMGLLLSSAAKGFDPFMPASWLKAVAAQPLIVQVIEVTIIADLGYYAIHRLFHQVPFLWRIHAVHHSIDEMDWLAAHRVHPIDQIATRGVSLIPIFVLGFEPMAIFIFITIFSWHSLLKHSNVKVGWGPLRWILATPAYHHWHHGKDAESLDKNFAGQLPIIDLIFGTAIMKESETPAAYGTVTPVPASYLGQNLLTLLPEKKTDPQTLPEKAD